MKLTRDSTASDVRQASAAHAHQPHVEEPTVSQQARLPSGPLEGLSSPGAGLRGRRAALSRRTPADTIRTETSLDASQRSDISDATFYSARMTLASLDDASSVTSAADATYAERSALAVDRIKTQIRMRLGALPFADPSQEQETLEAAYLEWADARVQERVAAFGPDSGYQVVGDMKAAGAEASLPIAYECLKAFIVGAMRSPVGLAAGAVYDGTRAPGSETLSNATLSGAVAGLASYTSDTLLIPAMDRRARVANLPRFQAIDPKILVPDPPPVLLEITAEGKRFTRPGEGNTATLPELKAHTYDLRAGVTQWQSTLDDKSLDTLLLKPTINAGFNAARRTSDDPGTRTPAGQLGLSMLAVGGAGVVQKAMLETGKAVARTGQMSVPDLLGGQQRLNLFALALPDNERRPAQWSSAVRFPNYLLETAVEGLALAKQALSTTNAMTTAVRDLLSRHMLSNVMGNIASLGASRLIAAPLRGGNESGAVAGEAANSNATVLQQAAQTLFNDTVWNALKAKNGANTTQATRLDQERAVAATKYRRTIARTLQALAEPIDEAITMFSGPTPAAITRAMEEGEQLALASGPLAQSVLRDALEILRTEIQTQSISTATIDTVLDHLHAGQAAMLGGVPRNDLTRTLETELKTLRRALHESEELRQWESGRP
ncbi:MULTISPECIES: type III secretion system effector XopF1 [Xanthomonas]|uniref:Type III secretion system effector protein n=1 Tax=Xanthomonas dyei TaxID=743699 RepID=A0ABZ0D9I1_9XANT|nr:type III secretion system effector XopF1 [Xanthomonas dyei]WOB26875.1 hypothetical protein NYR99_02415 [Xanthomonas dyei]WOB54494.1 hypothetical protein NYR95_02415 [Xanthomonas dyei]